jgi:hypothetical protein
MNEMNISTARQFLTFFLLAGASYAWAADPAGTKCGDLLKMQIDNATISEAIDVPAGKPVSVGGVYAPAVLVTSLPAHCLVQGEVNHHQGADGKDYGDKFWFADARDLARTLPLHGRRRSGRNSQSGDRPSGAGSQTRQQIGSQPWLCGCIYRWGTSGGR